MFRHVLLHYFALTLTLFAVAQGQTSTPQASLLSMDAHSVVAPAGSTDASVTFNFTPAVLVVKTADATVAAVFSWP